MGLKLKAAVLLVVEEMLRKFIYSVGVFFRLSTHFTLSYQLEKATSIVPL
jgi:hypothetical protein